MSAARRQQVGWLPEHERECEGFWLRSRNGGYHAEWRDPVTRKMRSKKVGVTYSEAFEGTRQLACRVRLGKPVAPTSALMWEVIEEWFASELIPPKYKPATIGNYAYYTERFLLPTFAERRFADIDPLTWQAFFDRIDEFDTADPARKRNQHVTVEQVNTVKKLSKSLARWAYTKGYTHENTAAAIRMTTVECRERETLTAEQFEFMLGFADEDYRVHLATLFWGGLRGCELAALPWRDVTFREDGFVDVRITQSLSRRIIGAPKTKGSARLITLPPHVADLLRVHMTRQAATQLPHPEGLVFTTRQGKTLNLQNFRARLLYPALDRANERLAEQGRPAIPRVELHGLRHSCITMLRSSGVKDIAVQKLAGHANLRMTDKYTHTDALNRLDVAHALESAHRQAESAVESTERASAP